MRTTLDIEDSLLAIARVRAREGGISVGMAVSELMRRGLAVPARPSRRGFPVFEPPLGAPTVTDEVVSHYRDDEANQP